MSSIAGRAPVCVIYNPSAGTAERIEELRDLLARDGRIELCGTEHAGHGGQLAESAVADARKVIIAAGGDGTVSEIVAGLMDARQVHPASPLPALLIAPMGTGNDLVRTLGLPDTLEENLALLDEGELRPLDVFHWTLTSPDGVPPKQGWGVNVINGGFSAKLREALTPELKKRWGPLAYARAALGSVGELDPHRLTFRVDDGGEQVTEAINVVVANARFAGGGIEVAPQADPFDGLLELVVILPGNFLDMAEVTTKLLVGDVDDSANTFHVTARRFTLSATPPIPFNIDGDLVGEGILSVEVVPAALQVLVPRRRAQGNDAA